jgi:hypothetical protein
LTWIGQSGLIVNLFSPKHEPRAYFEHVASNLNAESSKHFTKCYLCKFAQHHFVIVRRRNCATRTPYLSLRRMNLILCAASKNPHASFHQRRAAGRSRLLGNLTRDRGDLDARFTHIITQNSAVFSLAASRVRVQFSGRLCHLTPSAVSKVAAALNLFALFVCVWPVPVSLAREKSKHFKP